MKDSGSFKVGICSALPDNGIRIDVEGRGVVLLSSMEGIACRFAVEGDRDMNFMANCDNVQAALGSFLRYCRH